jgi:protein-tyrosine phosphatase
MEACPYSFLGGIKKGRFYYLRMSKILPRLWLSGAGEAYDGSFLRYGKITHVLNCAEELSARPQQYGTDVVIQHIPMEDDESPEVELQILKAVNQLQDWYRQEYRVLVHCRAGISRSPTVVIAWMMLCNNMSFDDAWKKVVAARNYIRPNDYFMKFLKNLEKEPVYNYFQ